MKKEKTYLRLTIILPILFGIILPLALGLRDLTLIAICFSSVWLIYAVLLLITTFLIRPSLRIKASRQKGVTVVRYELQNARNKK
jgi:uncharacterized membrane protein